MGNYVNKLFSYNDEARKDETHNNEIEREEIRESSAIDEVTVERDIMQTPPIHKPLSIDPRSATSGITRTPIELDDTPIKLNRRAISAIPRYLQSKPYLETDLDKIMLCMSPVKNMPEAEEVEQLELPSQHKTEDILLTPIVNNRNSNKLVNEIEKERYDILGIDPRSPAADFDRTPILAPKSLMRLKARSQERLHRQGSYDADMYNQKFSYCEMSSQFDITEVQALPDLATCAIKSLHLADLDLDKSSDSESPCSSRSTVTECASDTEQELEDEIENISKQNDYYAKCLKENKEDETCIGDTITVWKDSLVLDELQQSETSESDDTQSVQKKVSEMAKEEVIITFDDDSLVKDTLLQKLAKSESDKTKLDVAEKKKKILRSQTKQKTVTDEKRVFNFNDKNGNEPVKVRTPLGNRSNTGQMEMMLISSPQQMLRSKTNALKMLQENTPPHKKFVAKSKSGGTQWDPNSTVII
ncbi:uncharacterized protein LOC143429861 [Xylocopa sonorina]|uniref:uncharacterized protein LOC143429861 n=1 Tax=Xylocopa sonorina TaxID=1818115 RepID=UPI00403AB49F